MSQEAVAQERARSYFQSKAALPPSVVREQIATAFDALDATLGTMPPEHAARQAIPGEWSVQEIVDHLLETYRPGVDELRCLLAGQHPRGEPIPAALQSKAPLLRPWPWLLDEVRRTHHTVLELIDGVPPDLVIETRAPFTMVVNSPEPAARCGRSTGSKRSSGRRTRSPHGARTPSTTRSRRGRSWRHAGSCYTNGPGRCFGPGAFEVKR